MNNAQGRIKTGAYAFVHLKLPQSVRASATSLTIPANTLLFRSEGLRVGVVRNGRAELTPITIGRDFGATVEVVAGLQPTDQVIVNPSDSLTSGSAVQVSTPAAGGSQVKRGLGFAISFFGLLFSVDAWWVRSTLSQRSPWRRHSRSSLRSRSRRTDGWKPAQPGDQALRGKWWEIFGDPQLNELEEEVTQSNQDLKVAEARFRQARAMIRFNRSAEFPTISTSPSITNERFSANQPYFPHRRWRTMARALSPCLLISRMKLTCGEGFAVR